jgi:hypothetical protein
MLQYVLFALAGVPPTAPPPVVSVVVAATSNAGACVLPSGGTLTSARVGISWSLANSDGANYNIKVYKDGVLLTSGGMFTSYDEEITGVVEGGALSPYNASWVYRVDVIRNSDSAVVSTASSATWTKRYGTCRGGIGG